MCRAAAAVVLAALAGCGYVTRVDEPFWRAVKGPVAVEVESFNGDVLVTVDRQYPHALIQVKRRALFGSGREEEAQVALARVHYSADVVTADTGQVLKVRTFTDDPEPWFLRADVRIYLPVVDGLKVKTRNGKVYATDIEGTVDIDCEGGDVRIMTLRPLVSPVTIVNRDGDIDYRVRGGSTGEFECTARGGLVDQRALLGRVIIHNGTSQNALFASLNGGTNPVRLTTVDGDIRIAVIGNPMDVGMMIVDP